MKILLMILITVSAFSKTIKEGDQEFNCTPVKSCSQKLKEAYAEIKRLKKELKKQEAIVPLICEKEIVTVEKVVKKVKKHLVSVVGHNTIINTHSSSSTVGSTVSADAEIKTGYTPAVTYQYQFESGFTPLIGIDVKKNPKAIFGLGYEF